MNRNIITRNLQVILVTIITFSLFCFYMYIRRGMFSINIANKSLGSTAAILAGITLLIGPLSRTLPTFGKYLPLRRPLGILACITAFIHVAISLFFIPSRFNLPWFLGEWPATLTGLIAIIIWIYLLTISRNESIKKLGGSVWVKLQQRGGHTAFILVFAHLVFLKYSDWTAWVAGTLEKAPHLQNPQMVPENFIVFGIMAAIIIYRIILVLKGPKQ